MQSDEFVSFGSVLLNLGVTGHPKKGLSKGSYCLLVGGSNSGKTWLALTLAAEAKINPAFSEHRIIYNGPEDGARMDMERCFNLVPGQDIEMLTPGNGASTSPEEFWDRLEDDLKQGPCITICDSMDALLPKDDEEQIAKERKARESGKEASGSYGTAKARVNSQRIRLANQEVVKTGSILIIICQTRDNIGWGSQYNPDTRAGGTSLKFYAQTEIWLKRKQKLERPFKGNQVQVGAITQAKVKRTRFTGQEWEIEFPIYYTAGIDDVESCIRWLIEWKCWTGDKTKVSAPEFSFNGSIEKLAQEISNNDKYTIRLRNIVSKHWKAIAEHTKVERKSKYGN